MLNKDTYKRELVRMWDSIRTENKGDDTCYGVSCEDCPLDQFEYACSCSNSAFETVEVVERWSKEHPQKHNVSQLEYDILKLYSDNYFYYFYESELLMLLLKKGCFKGATSKTNISNYLNNCEVKEDV